MPKANLEFCCVLLINIQTHVATVDIVLVSRGEPRTKCWCSRFGRLASQQWKQAILSHSQGRGNRPSFADGTSSVSIGSSQTVTPKSPLTIKRYQKSHFQEGLSNKAWWLIYVYVDQAQEKHIKILTTHHKSCLRWAALSLLWCGKSQGKLGVFTSQRQKNQPSWVSWVTPRKSWIQLGKWREKWPLYRSFFKGLTKHQQEPIFGPIHLF